MKARLDKALKDFQRKNIVMKVLIVVLGAMLGMFALAVLVIWLVFLVNPQAADSMVKSLAEFMSPILGFLAIPAMMWYGWKYVLLAPKKDEKKKKAG